MVPFEELQNFPILSSLNKILIQNATVNGSPDVQAYYCQSTIIWDYLSEQKENIENNFWTVVKFHPCHS